MKTHELVAATFAAVGQEISDMALTLICRDLEPYPISGLTEALGRCRKELRRITLADILDRLPGGLPGPEEAWAIVSATLDNEDVTIVWTDEIAAAFGIALGCKDDPVAARMAFKEAYSSIRARARAEGRPVVWRASIGRDPNGREGPIRESVQKGRLAAGSVAGLIPYFQPTESSIIAIAEKAIKR